MVLFWILLYAVAFGTVTALAAKDRERDPTTWFLIGFVFGVFGLIAVLVVESPDEEDEGTLRRPRPAAIKKESSMFDPSDMTKKCCNCAEEIKFEAKVCRFCGHTFTDDELNASLEVAKKKFEEAVAKRKSDERLQEIRARRGW